MRVGLIACSKKKLSVAAPAKELYQGNLFKLAQRWIKKRVDTWGIFSAYHGLVLPDQVIEPYDLALADMTPLNRDRWAEMVKRQLWDEWGDDPIYMVLLGSYYQAAVRDLPYVEDPIAHWTEQRRQKGMSGRRASMGIGVIMKYLKEDRGYS